MSKYKNILTIYDTKVEDCYKYKNIYSEKININYEEFEGMKNEFNLVLALLGEITINNKHITVENIYYGYYYIFYIKEIPGWRFAINLYQNKEVCGEPYEYLFFCQYEKYIDKFTSGYSTYTAKGYIYTNDKQDEIDAFGINRIINFIKTHKYKSIYRDIALTYYDACDTDSWIKDFIYVEKRNFLKKISEKSSLLFNKIMCIKLKNLLSNYYNKNDIYILDFGESWSPRYEARILIEDTKNEEDTSFCDFNAKAPLGVYGFEELSDAFYKFESKLEKLFHMFGFNEFCEVSDCFSLSIKQLDNKSEEIRNG